MRFREYDDFYLDTITGLEWSKESRGLMTWYEAIKGPKSWRLPTMEELLAIVDYNTYEPATKLPIMISECYWSSTAYAKSSDDVWLVHFQYGDVLRSNKSNAAFVRAVRG